MDATLTPKFFKGNRDKLLKDISADLVVISSNGLVQKSMDEAFPFRQDSNFWYLTGINKPGLVLVKTRAEEFLISADNYMETVSFATPTDNRAISKTSGIAEILSKKQGWEKLDSLINAKTSVATLLPSPVLLKHYGIYSNPARRQLVNTLKRRHPWLKLIDARKQLGAQRMLKQPVEIALIQKAVDITCETLKGVLYKGLDKYKDTSQIDRDIVGGFLTRGGSGYSFEPVVAAGKNATTIHYEELSQPLKAGELIVTDVGCGYSFYGSDIARTLSYGQVSPRQQAVFEAVRYVQSEAYKLIKPGMIHKDYEKQVEIMIGQQLKQLGVISRISRQSVRKHYPHLCSHSLGLDTHDSADYSRPLPENMVMTVEPGIYLPEEGIGVRIEDVIRITKDGCQVMSAALPNGLKL